MPSPVYLFTLGALATFFACQLIWPQGVRHYRSESLASATVDRRLRDDWARQLEKYLDEQRALAGVAESAPGDTDDPGVASPFSARLRGSRPDRLEVVIEAVDRDPGQAYQRLEEAVQVLAGWRPDPAHVADRQDRETQWIVREAEHYHRKAVQQLESFLVGHFEGFPTSPASGDSEEGAAAAGQLNPEWEAGQHELDDLVARVDRMLMDLTPEHPQVKETLQRIDEVKVRLARTDKYLVPPAAEGVAPAAGANSLTGVETQWSAEDLSRAAQEYARLREQLSAAEDRLEEVRAAQQRAAEQTTQADSRPVCWFVRPVATDRPVAAATPPLRFFVPASAGLFVGGLLAWWACSLRPLLRFQTRADVREELGLPVVGELSADWREPSTPTAILARRKRNLRWTSWACELSLTAALALCLLRALAVSPYSERFAEDPFATFAETVEGLGRRG